MPRYEIQKINSMTCVVNVHLAKGEKSFDIYNGPDHHWDNPKCDRDLLKEHLEDAVKKQAVIIMPGDTFCFMQGKYDPRRSKSDIRPEHNKVNYIDAVINDAAVWYSPYKQNMILGQGNHESALLKQLETDVLERFSGAMGGTVPVMGYHGWVIFKIHWEGQHRATLRYYFHHGYGGGGMITRGQISMSRHLMAIEGADVISQGHIHEKSTTETMVHYFDDNSAAYKPKARGVLLVQSSTYKQEYIEGGYHVQSGRPAKPLGGTSITVHVSRDKKGSGQLVKEARFSGPRHLIFNETN